MYVCCVHCVCVLCPDRSTVSSSCVICVCCVSYVCVMWDVLWVSCVVFIDVGLCVDCCVCCVWVVL